jgi:hypothetical protein
LEDYTATLEDLSGTIEIENDKMGIGYFIEWCQVLYLLDKHCGPGGITSLFFKEYSGYICPIYGRDQPTFFLKNSAPLLK